MPRQYQGTAREGVKHQLHRRVLAASRAPNGNQEILGNDRNFVENKKLKQVKAEEDAIDRADQHQVEREEFLDPQFDVPGKKNAGDGGNSSQQNQNQADAVSRQVIFDAQRRDPWRSCNGN